MCAQIIFNTVDYKIKLFGFENCFITLQTSNVEYVLCNLECVVYMLYAAD